MGAKQIPKNKYQNPNTKEYDLGIFKLPHFQIFKFIPRRQEFAFP
jgi:hypothetical protein